MKNMAADRRNGTGTMVAISFVLLVVFGTGQSAFGQQWTGTTDISNTNSGNVGIGTTSPQSLLHVYGSSGTVNVLIGNGINSESRLRLSYDFSADKSVINSYRGASGYKAFEIDGSSLSLNANSGGNVGIGTTSPGSKLEVSGDVRVSHGAGSLYFDTNSRLYSDGSYSILTDLDGNPRAYFAKAAGDVGNSYYDLGNNSNAAHHFRSALGAADLMVIKNGGNVGIGTTSPTSKLTIVTDGNYEIESSGISGFDITTPATNGGYLALSSRRGTGIFIDTSNNVGIGTSTPSSSYKLDVNGDVRVSGNISAKYQDVAEWVPASEQLSAGTVVVLDSTKSNQVTSSSVSYDTRVAGVVSVQPGIALGEKSENKVLVATTGRVRVKVDASKAAIHIGDLLVTSDIPGLAMKSEPVEFAGRKMHMPGTLIGKALEPLEKGKGEILVLLSLQ